MFSFSMPRKNIQGDIHVILPDIHNFICVEPVRTAGIVVKAKRFQLLRSSSAELSTSSSSAVVEGPQPPRSACRTHESEEDGELIIVKNKIRKVLETVSDHETQLHILSQLHSELKNSGQSAKANP